MPKGPVLTVVITSVNEGLDKGLKDAEKKLGGFEASGDRVAVSLAKIGVPDSALKSVAGLAKGLGAVAKVAAPVAGVAAVVAKLGAAGDKAATQQKAFNEALIATGVAEGAMNERVTESIALAKENAFSTQQARDAFVALQTATADAAESQDLMTVAMDVARLTGADLTVAADAVSKAYAGNDRALRALIPGLAKTDDAFLTIANAQEVAAGQADIFANSAEGMGIKTKNALKGIAVTIGKAVAPAFKGMLAGLLPIIEQLGKLVNNLLPVLIPMMKLVAKAFEVAAKAITKVLELINRLINAVKNLLAPLDRAIAKLKQLNPFQGTINRVINGNTATAAGLTTTTRAGGSTTHAAGVTINIYGDPAVIQSKVVRALRDYQARNGVGSVFAPGRI